MKCSYCGIELTIETRTVDHVFPKSYGGKKSGNAVWACKDCNALKGNKLLSPIEPQWVRAYKQKHFDKVRNRIFRYLSS